MDKQYILSVAKQAGDFYSGLYYDLDLENDGVGTVFCDPFEWDRQKSNANVKEKGFSFYLARTIFQDRFWVRCGSFVVNGEKREKVIGCPFGSDAAPLLVVVDLALEGGRYRIISSWENENLHFEAMYRSNLDRERRRLFSSFSDEEVAASRQALANHVWKTWPKR
jgi:uncharacterized DUF497 family protein